MKLIKHDSSQMVFRANGDLFSRVFIIFWGLGFAGIPALMGFMIIKNLGGVNLSCDRLRWNQVNCQISKAEFFGILPGETTKINGILSAKHLIGETKDSDGDRLVDHRVILSTKGGNVTYGEGSAYINGVKGSLEDSVFIANSINQFIGSRELKLNLNRNLSLASSQVFMLLFLVPFLLIGLGTMYSILQSTTLILDKNLSQVMRRNLSLLGVRVKTFPLADANRVEIENYTDSYDNTYFTPVIKLTSGEKFPLERVGHKDQAVIMANQIRKFLYLPTES